MLNDWFSHLEFETDWETFQKLPRHPAYRYEFRKGQCSIQGRPLFYHAVLSLQELLCDRQNISSTNGFVITEWDTVDEAELSEIFARAFARTVPFVHLSQLERSSAAQSLLARALTSQDGPLVHEAAMVIRNLSTGQICGAILPSLIPSNDFKHFSQNDWNQVPPEDAIQNRWGFPHLTWVFVDPGHTRKGLAASLLQASTKRLLDLGYHHLYSTFLLGNSASTLWHWKMGFELISHPSSK